MKKAKPPAQEPGKEEGTASAEPPGSTVSTSDCAPSGIALPSCSSSSSSEAAVPMDQKVVNVHLELATRVKEAFKQAEEYVQGQKVVGQDLPNEASLVMRWYIGMRNGQEYSSQPTYTRHTGLYVVSTNSLCFHELRIM